tara:strand:+ start:2907 stop:3812 length:906 start_codon:yes stop_codon:yes gene_type:complete
MIQLLVTDFDGVITDNTVLTDSNGVESVVCSKSDSLGIERLKEINIQVIVLSSERNEVVAQRSNKLGLEVRYGVSDKRSLILELAKDRGMEPENIGFIGNDLNDLPAIESGVVSFCPQDAVTEIKAASNFVLRSNGGHGVIREVANLLFEMVNSSPSSVVQKCVSIEKSQPRSMGHREWGEETLLMLSSGNYMVKRIILKAGYRGGLQYHRVKDETAVIIKGKMTVRHLSRGGTLGSIDVGPGDCLRFPPYAIHQEIAHSDVEIIECSNPVVNDRVHCESCFDEEESGGLPTTAITEIGLV